jgi:hypothetical protein
MFSFLPPNYNQMIDPSLEAKRGDSSGCEGTSSDDSSADESGVPGIVAKTLRNRRRILFLTSLKKLCLRVVIENIPKNSLPQNQKLIFPKVGKKLLIFHVVKIIFFHENSCLGKLTGETLNLIIFEMCPTLKVTENSLHLPSPMGSSLDFVKMLLHEDLEEFNFALLRNSDEVQNLWPLLPELCPNLKMIIHRHYSTTQKPQMPMGTLKQFKKLEAIVLLEYTCDDNLLEQLANTFPNLK